MKKEKYSSDSTELQSAHKEILLLINNEHNLNILVILIIFMSNHLRLWSECDHICKQKLR